MRNPLIYLDYNATCPIYPQVAERVVELLAAPHNPSAVHNFGRKARQVLELSRESIAHQLSAFPREVIFTASGTEANNLALRSQPNRRVLVSAVEHSSVLRAAEAQTIPIDRDGVVKLEALTALLSESDRPALVSVMLANNETGVLQPIVEISALCKAHNALLHCDAVQALGKIPVNFSQLGADMLSLSAHKCGGPVGAAALVVRSDLAIYPLLTGGGQELGRRAGTENVAAIAGFAMAVDMSQNLSQMSQLGQWRDGMEQALLEAMPNAVIFGREVARLPNTSCIAMPGVSNESQLMAFDLAGMSVSAGSACASGRIAPSHVLTAMGVPPGLAGNTIRVSFGWRTTQDELTAFAAEWKSLAARLGDKTAISRL